ncbi:MAG: Rrf2 family transcriptional regulator [Verrucomicrobia bacterium]|jgi:Rrf2 family protein|nr:Rrf2 family transcriptional regulator [Verrucomicrobiota bacterium]MBT7068551.1 Rrf2 family transcriptional regulator [Verrucomicrobiota bacterium]
MMKLSTRGRYAMRIMVYLAMQNSDVPCRKQEVADAESISADYVEQILIRLKAAGLVTSHRGARGGFSLTQAPGAVTVADVLAATEGPLSLVSCSDEACQRETVCVTQHIWRAAENALSEVFSGTTIADLAESAAELAKSKSITYDI